MILGSSIFMNLLLIYLIINQTSRHIGAYRYFLLAFAMNDVYFPIVHFLTLPVVCTYKDAYFMFSNGILTSKFSISFFASTFSQTMPLLSHLFIYRLVATRWPHNLRFYTKRACFLLVVLTVGVESSVWFANCFVNFGSDEEFREYVHAYLEVEFGGKGKEFIGTLYYNSNGQLNVRTFLATMGFNAIMLTFMLIITFCAISIVSFFGTNNNKLSGKTKKLQQQLFYTLIAQMLFPVLFVYLPCMGTINFPIFGFRVELFPKLVSICIAMYPWIDAVIIMVGMTSYRDTILTALKCQPSTINA